MSHCILTRSTDFVAGTSGAAVVWDTDDQTGSWWEGVTNPSRITIPSGITEVEFLVGCTDRTGNASGASLIVDLYKNGSQIYRYAVVSVSDYSSTFQSLGMHSVTSGDYFEIYIWNDGVAANFDLEDLYFAAIPTGYVAGAAHAFATDNLNVSTEVEVTFQTPDLDTHSTFDGTSVFTVPSGVTHAIVDFRATTNSAAASGYTDECLLMINGVMKHKRHNEHSNYGKGACFLTAVSAGQEITINYSRVSSGFLSGTESQISIEWLNLP